MMGRDTTSHQQALLPSRSMQASLCREALLSARGGQPGGEGGLSGVGCATPRPCWNCSCGVYFLSGTRQSKRLPLPAHAGEGGDRETPEERRTAPWRRAGAGAGGERMAAGRVGGRLGAGGGGSRVAITYSHRTVLRLQVSLPSSGQRPTWHTLSIHPIWTLVTTSRAEAGGGWRPGQLPLLRYCPH